MDDASTRSFWRTLPGILTGAAGLVTAIAALIGALVSVGVLSGDDGDAPSARSPTAAVSLSADADLAAGRIEEGCLGFQGLPPTQCRCFAERVAAALPAEDLDAASREFRAEGRFAIAEQQELADDVLLLCRQKRE